MGKIKNMVVNTKKKIVNNFTKNKAVFRLRCRSWCCSLKDIDYMTIMKEEIEKNLKGRKEKDYGKHTKCN